MKSNYVGWDLSDIILPMPEFERGKSPDLDKLLRRDGGTMHSTSYDTNYGPVRLMFPGTGIYQDSITPADREVIMSSDMVGAASIQLPSGKTISKGAFNEIRKFYHSVHLGTDDDHSCMDCNSAGKYEILDPPKFGQRAAAKKSYDELYWNYVHATSEQEYEAYQALMASVDLNMKSGDGSWVNTPDPEATKVEVQKYISQHTMILPMNSKGKLNLFDAIPKFSWSTRYLITVPFVLSTIWTISHIVGWL